MVNERTALGGLLRESGVEAALSERLARYGTALLEANRRFNLTGARSPGELAPHILDSLRLAPLIRGPMADIGSGGGLPAIPVALATGASVTLIESTAKKAAFLQDILTEFELTGRAIAKRAEVAAHDPALREQFASATARAVSSAPAVVELTVPFLRIGGRALLQRGKIDERERDAVADAAPIVGARLADEIVLEGDRRILIVEKIGPTPARFPRRTGVPQKRPLCF